MTPWNVLVLSLATSSTQTISPSPTVMSLNTWGGGREADAGMAPVGCPRPPAQPGSQPPAPLLDPGRAARKLSLYRGEH